MPYCSYSCHGHHRWVLTRRAPVTVRLVLRAVVISAALSACVSRPAATSPAARPTTASTLSVIAGPAQTTTSREAPTSTSPVSTTSRGATTSTPVPALGALTATQPAVRVTTTALPAPTVSTGSAIWPAPGEAALTFDDGPGDATSAILDILEQVDVAATFFVVGRAVAGHTTLLVRMVADGDEVENHSWDHPYLTRLSPGAVARQLERTNSAVSNATGRTPTCFRPPYFATDDVVVAVAASVGLEQILANVDPHDYSRPEPPVITARVLGAAHGQGLVVVLHDGGIDRSRTVAALPGIIEGLRQNGYRFVALCQAG